MEETQQSYWDKVREFNLSRTPFWICCLVQLFLTILPFIAIWILVGPDFKYESFNFYSQLLNPHVGYLCLIVVSYLIYTNFIAAIIWLLHWQKADIFTYTLGLTFVFISVILNGIWMIDWEFSETIVRLLIRFVIAIGVGLIGVFFGVVITTFARNADYKMEEKNYEMVMTYRGGDTIDPSIIMEQTSTLDEKLIQKYDEYQAKQKEAKEKQKKKLDEKEAKQRKKDEEKQK